ncbi:amino acid ABC transporter permease [Pseudomonas chlororaphis]|uniref:amino acid ABC transporter permease n=1 Tax=Pseudomonas chlororaphis TaxID=587753 RepID=UPI0006A620D4|nr:amino acid ABC transporter permease [Pseudomonas chlororaphis]AZD02927.1 Glutamate Aspartate transport system permease protein GltJ [Pseudomonas chlororaphis subsp. chlororaphis]MBM0282929.1 amino acid ABC transporter permease [Pseudomonas chlororaphis]MDO1508539.1 amino acid ABC transporter permease [Pseudomonas chlororaphis]ORM45628.1 amino acid ABC transporter permease [Pseudomonas chlororaphis subsp. chlororaphis]TWR91905.1 amino acid ABC transporter permease [Pseudomonas chlororaphis s
MSLLNEYGAALLLGLALTLLLSVTSWLAAFLIALALTLVRMTKVRALELLVLAFIEYQRNVPPLVHIFLWYFGVSSVLPEALQDWVNANHGEFIFAALAIALYYGAYFAEDIRSGLRSIAQGQQEAARALGLSYAAAMRRVVLPQALRVAIAPLVSGTVMLVKTTSLAMVIGVMELTYVTKEISSATFRIFETYAISTVMYVVVALGLLFLGHWLGQCLQIKGR